MTGDKATPICQFYLFQCDVFLTIEGVPFLLARICLLHVCRSDLAHFVVSGDGEELGDFGAILLVV